LASAQNETTRPTFGAGTGSVTTDIPARLDRLPWSRFHVLIGGSNEDLIKDYAPKNMTEAQRAGWVERKTAKLLRLREEEAARHVGTPRDVAWNAWNAATIALKEATDQLVTTRPTTVAGVAAVLATWAEFDYSEAAESTFAHDENSGFLGELAESCAA
jgi:hypothetical protein